jgi:fucose permease
MRFFSLFDFQYFILALFLGFISVLIIYFSFGREEGEAEKGIEHLQLPEGLQKTKNRIPTILLFVYIGFLVWAILYVIFIGIRGGAI